MNLRDYQRAAVDSLYQVWNDGKLKNPLIVAPTGAGKSPILGTLAAEVAQDPDSRVIVLTHRAELIKQDKRAIEAFTSVPVGIWSAQLKKKEKGKRIMVAGINSIYKKACDFDPFDVAIIDECFVAGTKVLTPKGFVDIDKVRCGDIVLNQAGFGSVEGISCRPAYETILLELDDGRKIECTGNHPFFTDSGWVEARKLEGGSYLLGAEDLSMLWFNFSSLDEIRPARKIDFSSSGVVLEKAKLLLSEVCKEIKPNVIGQASEIENKQTPERNQTSAYKTWRERAIASFAAIGITARPWGWLDCGTADKNTRWSQKWNIPELLQGGHSKRNFEDCNRAGWGIPLSNREERVRHKKNEFFNGSRVVNISSVKRKSPIPVFNLQVSGHPSYFVEGIAVHNCHLLGRSDNSMYQRFLRDAWMVNPKMKLVGLSATPYRLDSGYLYEGSDALFDGVAYEIGVKYLIDNKYLSPVISKGGVQSIDLSGVHKRGGEFVASELAAAADTASLVDMATDEICHYGADRRSWLLFCAGVEHAQHVSQAINSKGFRCEVVHGKTSQEERERIYAGMRDGSIRAIANCQVLTTGFDLPQIDLVALLTATESTGLYVQMVGRGTRIANGKDNCLLLDYGGNVVRHGVFDDVQPKFSGEKRGEGDTPAKVCPSCMEVVHAAVRTCQNCGHEFPPPEVVHEVRAYSGAVLKEQVTVDALDVMSVSYHRHNKVGRPPSVRVDYHCGWLIKHSEWLCPEHEGYPRRSFESRCMHEWRVQPFSNCDELLRYAENLPKPKKIRIKQQPGKKFAEIIGRTY